MNRRRGECENEKTFLRRHFFTAANGGRFFLYNATVFAKLSQYDEIIDVRSPAEFADDHIPGARNLPVLKNDERALVGALHKSDPHLARLRGAKLLAKNIADFLDGDLSRRAQNWKPLVYCWRGGQRSDAVVEVFRRIGWRAEKLDGGYKTYRRAVMAEIQSLPPSINWRVLAGKTGAGKTALLKKLHSVGAATLDLEKLAHHRGSVFGGLGEQPSQRKFESSLLFAMLNLPAQKTVFVESESRKIGELHLPAGVLQQLRRSPAVRLLATLDNRARHICDNYPNYIGDGALFMQTINRIKNHAGKKKLARWQALHLEKNWRALAADLLLSFYDIGYEKSLNINFPNNCQSLEMNPNDDNDITRTAKKLIADNEK